MDEERTSYSPYACLLAAACIWGASPIIMRVLLNGHVPAPAIVAVRYVLAAFGLAPAAMVAAARRPQRAPVGAWIQLIAVGALGSGIGALLFIYAVKLSSAGIVNALSKSQPIFVVFLAFFLLRERPTPARLLMMGTMVAACVLIAVGEFVAGGGAPRHRLLGDGLALLAGLSWALAVIMGKRALTAFRPEFVAMVRFAVGFLVATVFAWATGTHVSWSELTPFQWALLLSLGLICGSLALALYYRGLAKLEAHVAASLELVGPIITALLAIIVLGDVLNMYHVMGIVLLLSGAYMIIAQRGESGVVVDESAGASVAMAPPEVAQPQKTPPAMHAPGKPMAEEIGPRPEVRLGLQFKIAALSVVLILATMVPASLLLVRHTHAVVSRQIQNTMVNMAQLIATMPRSPNDPRAWQRFEAYLDEIVQARVEADEYTIDTVYIAVRDERDEVRAFAFNSREYELRDAERGATYHTGDRVAARRLLRQAEAGDLAGVDIFPVVARVGAPDAPTRTVDIGYRRSISRQPIQRIAAVNSAVTLVLIILGVVASMKLSARLTRPMQELNAAMQEVGKGRLDQHVTPRSEDEVAVMAWEFNRMVVGLRERAFLRSALQRYVSVQVADKMIQEGEWWFQPEERQVTVMFSDIRGFTPLSERLTPGQVFEMLNEHFGVMVDIIFAHQGTLDKFIGDCIMAVWGSPHQVPEHPLLAVKAGLAMQEALGKLNERRAADGKEPIRMGVGINTGAVYAGSLGLDTESAHRLEYAVIGDDVNLAQRIESQTKPTQVLISQSTYDLVREYVEARALEPIQVKGKAHKVRVYEVTGILGPEPRRADSSVAETFGSASED